MVRLPAGTSTIRIPIGEKVYEIAFEQQLLYIVAFLLLVILLAIIYFFLIRRVGKKRSIYDVPSAVVVERKKWPHTNK